MGIHLLIIDRNRWKKAAAGENVKQLRKEGIAEEIIEKAQTIMQSL